MGLDVAHWNSMAFPYVMWRSSPVEGVIMAEQYPSVTFTSEHVLRYVQRIARTLCTLTSCQTWVAEESEGCVFGLEMVWEPSRAQ